MTMTITSYGSAANHWGDLGGTLECDFRDYRWVYINRSICNQ